jgi:excisionase family DNA binding protein
MFSEYKDFITADELAEILRLNVKTVIKLAKEKTLPSMKIANQFRFSKEKLIEWIESEMNDSSENFLTDLEKTLDDFEVQVHRMLSPSHIVLKLKAEDKAAAVNELLAPAVSEGILKNEDTLLQDIMAREESHTTAVGHGVAFPHARSVPYEVTRRPLLFLGLSETGIDFMAYDGQPVRIMAVVIIPQLSVHLHVLARLSLILRDKDVRNSLLAARSPEDVLAVIREKERELDALEGKNGR